MSEIFISLICLVAVGLIAVCVCVKITQGTSFANAFRSIGIFIRSFFNYGYSKYTQSKNREYLFRNLPLAVDPFTYILEDELHLCKRCRLWQSYPINQDVQFLSFKLMGITKAYEETELTELLAAELQGIYARCFGEVCPLVYPVSLDQNIIGFWIATNLHGNDLIRQRKNHDYYVNCDNPRELEED